MAAAAAAATAGSGKDYSSPSRDDNIKPRYLEDAKLKGAMRSLLTHNSR